MNYWEYPSKWIEESKQDKRPLYKKVFNWKSHISPLAFTLFIIFILLIVGCAPISECPTVTCPNSSDTPTISKKPPLVIFKLHAGQEPVYVGVRQEVNIYNCGSEAYGPIISTKIKEYITDEKDTSLVIIKTTPEAIGGCPDILIDHPEIKVVKIYDIARDTDSYRNLINWIPPSKLNIMTEEFELIYATEPVDLYSLTEERTEIYAPWELEQ